MQYVVIAGIQQANNHQKQLSVIMFTILNVVRYVWRTNMKTSNYFLLFMCIAATTTPFVFAQSDGSVEYGEQGADRSGFAARIKAVFGIDSASTPSPAVDSASSPAPNNKGAYDGVSLLPMYNFVYDANKQIDAFFDSAFKTFDSVNESLGKTQVAIESSIGRTRDAAVNFVVDGLMSKQDSMIQMMLGPQSPDGGAAGASSPTAGLGSGMSPLGVTSGFSNPFSPPNTLFSPPSVVADSSGAFGKGGGAAAPEFGEIVMMIVIMAMIPTLLVARTKFSAVGVLK